MNKPMPVTIERKPNAEVVRVLEMALEEARTGELQGFCLAGVNARGDVLTKICGERMVFSQVGALEALKLRMLLQKVEGIREEISGILT